MMRSQGLKFTTEKSLGYNINENYYANKDNNEIELQVRYQGLVYAAKTNFSFLKDGENGTNGTGYVLKDITRTKYNRKTKSCVSR